MEPGTFLEIEQVCAQKGGAVIGNRLDGPLEPGRLRGEARDDRVHQHARADAGVIQLADSPQSLEWVRGAGLENPPRVLVHSRNAHIHRAAGSPGEFEQHVLVPHHHRPLCNQADGRARVGERFERPSCDLVVTLDGLVHVGRGPECHVLPLPRRAIELAPQHVDKVLLHENDRRKLVAGAHLELRVIAAREAVVATVGAAAIRIERPFERHPFHRVQGRTAGHFLIACAIGTVRGIRQSFDCAVLTDLVGDIPGGGSRGREIKEEGVAIW